MRKGRVTIPTDENYVEGTKKIAEFFNFNKIENVIFTNNITSSLNILINGILKPGDHVITSSMEHNSVIRPLYNLNTGSVIPNVRPKEFTLFPSSL